MTWTLESFTPGQVIPLGTRTVTEAEILAFAKDFDPQPFHVDHDAAAQSIYGGIIASGWHTCSMIMRAVVDNMLNDSTSMGSPGLEQVRWLKPVRPNDTLTISSRVLEVRPSTSKPDRGVVLTQWEAHNQHGDLVCTITGMGMFGRKKA